MAYISPNSDLLILEGVSLDKNYNHTLRVTDTSIQYTKFQPYVKYTLDNLSYQRYAKNVIRVGMVADNLYTCNYMMFRNTSYGSNWFYAFIDRVDYINDNCTEIEYTIDELQTWATDYYIYNCYVEREHSLTDNYGEHLIPEEVDTGELVPQQTWDFTYPDSINPQSPMYELVVLYVPNNSKNFITGVTYSQGDYVWTLSKCKAPDLNNVYNIGMIVNGIYVGCKYWSVSMHLGININETKQEIDSLISEIIGPDIEGTIVNIVQVPWQVWYDWTVAGGASATRNCNHNIQLAFYNPTHTSSYTPKNKKLYSAPFRHILVSNNAGQTGTFKWEYFSARNQGLPQATYKVTGVPIMSPEIMCYPANYRGIVSDYESGIVLNDFPTPPWSEDSFTKWWSQNKESYILSILTTAISSIAAIAAGVGTSNPVAVAGGVLSLGSKIGSSVGTLMQATNTPDQLYGQVNCSSLRTIQNRIGFKFYDMGVEKDKAETIDNYFTMFGYAVKKVKAPNIFAHTSSLRPYWNYIKTSGCIIHSHTSYLNKGLSAGSEQIIAKAFDNGITFWESLADIGDYSLNNAPRT